MIVSEKKLTSTSTYDTFDEIYTNYDLSVNETYSAADGYPFDYPTRWLNDPSMNKRIAIRRLDVTPSTHSFKLYLKADTNDDEENTINEKTARIDVTEYDNLVKVLNAICNEYSYTLDESTGKKGGLGFEYDNSTNKLGLYFLNTKGESCSFFFFFGNVYTNEDLEDFLMFLNQPTNTTTHRDICENMSETKKFYEVWNRDRIHFHASFSTSKRKFIGKRGDFYQTLTLLYPPPTNESTFYVRMTSNGITNILLRYCEFDVQLCFIVNYKKAKVI